MNKTIFSKKVTANDFEDTTDSTGNTTSFSIIPPFVTVFAWKHKA